ncbi:MAG: hypothetical protein JWM41_800 [Gemmatimonadetes bacterium]|nr:hypothetical protein [Gemmatimonadota bacterium]
MAVALVIARGASAQTQYYNLDGGRPGRVEDAEATARYALAVDLGPFQYERLAGGTNRFRAEPKISYGVLPFTEIELRLPIVRVDPPRAAGARSAAGVAALAIGALHAFNLESSTLPALALGGEVTLPVGSLAGPRTAYIAKLLATKTSALGRIHLNLGAGTYSVRTSAQPADTACTAPPAYTFQLPGQSTCAGGGPPVIFDSPCNVVGPKPAAGLQRSMMCMGASAPSSAPAPNAPRARGSRWLAGLGLDHAFALQSTLVTADLVAEHFVGLYAPVDWTVETGVRRQLTPKMMIDAGIGWHFAGIVRSTSLILGATYEIAAR